MPNRTGLLKDRMANSLSAASALIILVLYAGIFYPGNVWPEEETGTVDVPVVPAQMEKSLENALASHRAELTDLKAQVRHLETIKEAVQSEVKAYDSQNTAQGQLLLVSRLRIEDLENALKNNRRASRTLAERLETFQERWDSASILATQTADRIELAQKQIAAIQQSQFPGTHKQKLEAANRKLLQVLQEKKRRRERYLQIYGDLLGRMKAALEAKKTIGEKLATQLKSRKKTSLFTRSDRNRSLSGEAFQERLRLFGSRIGAVFSPALWKVQWGQIKMDGVARWAVFLIFLISITALQSRCRALLQRIEKSCEGPGWYFRCMGLLLLRRSLPYLGMTALFGIYSSFQLSLLDIGLGRFLFHFFLILLITRWGFDYLEYGFRGPPTGLRSFASRHLKRLFRLFRTMAFVIIILTWVAGRDSLLTWMARDVLAAVLLAWTVVFWRQMKPVVAEGMRDGQAGPDPKWIALFRGWGYLVFGGTLLLNLVGYGHLAGHWIGAWTATAALLFWGWISLNAIREWHHDHQAEATAADEEHPLTSAHEWRWCLIHLVRDAWFFVLVASVLWVWDSDGYIQSHLGHSISLTFTIGSLKLSIKGIALAVAIIYLTYIAVRIGRSLLNHHILDKQPLERGLKDSILTISSYLGWGLGLLLALGVLGVNATSLAVVFGAMSIGIGFGLQNIFNNFISGLILLFERPIQVGDYIEINGLWAEVKKINVRATVVQTFDNASVIIPNSDLISQQVTNWSFKDKRMRRQIEVGVAYGSDIDLVQKTLLGVARETPEVLKYPRPDVLFIDHADSALVFRLRIWTHVGHYWQIPSQIRCEIDRRFRQLGIEIAFPQQDLHIRSYPEEFRPQVPDPEKT